MVFGRTSSALDADGFGRSTAGFAVALLLLAAWGWWFARSSLALYEVSSVARLETGGAATPIESPLDGRLVSNRLTMGLRVETGDELARLESEAELLARGEQLARVTALEPQLEATRDEIASIEQAGRDERRASEAALAVAREQVRESDSPAKFAEEDLARLRRMRGDGLITERDLSRGLSEAERLRSAASGARLALDRLEREQQARDSERQGRIERLRGQMRQLEGDVASGRAAVARLDFEIARRVIRAPVSGEIAEAATIKPGAFLTEGMRLGAIVPDGRLRVVAEYRPASALGRIRPGQPARLRLEGFPWMQYRQCARNRQSGRGRSP